MHLFSPADFIDNSTKTETIWEVVLPNPKIFLKAGLQIVNNGLLIDGTLFCLIDTSCRKDYIRKVRDLPMNVMKTQSAFNEMSAPPRLSSLFKCMDRSCTETFNSKELFKLHMQLHYSNAEKNKSKKLYFKSLFIQNNMFYY